MWPYPKIIAHRGGGSLAPENTLAAMRCGLERGFHAVEFDVMLSKDCVPIVMHDPVLGRTVAGSGNVNEYTAQQLAAMDAGSWFDATFRGEPIPAYEQVLRFCRDNRIWMNVEIKPAPNFDDATGHVVAKLTQRLFADAIAAHVPGINDATLPLFSSFSFDALLTAKKTAPEIPRGWLTDTVPDDWRQKLDQLGAVSLHTNHLHLTPELAQSVKHAGFGLLCYTVNDAARAREILSWGVDAFCTDRIDLIGPDF